MHLASFLFVTVDAPLGLCSILTSASWQTQATVYSAATSNLQKLKIKKKKELRVSFKPPSLENSLKQNFIFFLLQM